MKKLQEQLVNAVNVALQWHDENDVKQALESIMAQFDELLKAKEEKEKPE